jgi:RNA polymerase sigma factor (sigma-70 family)
MYTCWPTHAVATLTADVSPTGRGSSAPSSHTSEHLFARARLGDANALGRLIARYLPGLHRWAHGRLSRAARTRVDTADLVQDAALGVLPRAGRLEFQNKRAFIGYLRETVLNRIRDEHRAIARHGTTSAPLETLVDSRPSPLRDAITADLESKYRRALERLRPQDRELVVAHIELGFSHKQLGLVSAKTPNAARMALQRALEQLAQHMLKG